MSYTWTDDPLTNDTPIKTDHIEELRDAVNNERSRRNLDSYTWTDDPLTNDTPIKTIHIEELRDAINDTSNYSACSAEYASNNSNDNTDYDSTVYNTVDVDAYSNKKIDYRSTVYSTYDGARRDVDYFDYRSSADSSVKAGDHPQHKGYEYITNQNTVYSDYQ